MTMYSNRDIHPPITLLVAFQDKMITILSIRRFHSELATDHHPTYLHKQNAKALQKISYISKLPMQTLRGTLSVDLDGIYTQLTWN